MLKYLQFVAAAYAATTTITDDEWNTDDKDYTGDDRTDYDKTDLELKKKFGIELTRLAAPSDAASVDGTTGGSSTAGTKAEITKLSVVQYSGTK